MDVYTLDAQAFRQRWAKDYQDFLERHPDSKVYHTLEWHSIIQETYGYAPTYILAEQSGRLQGVLPLFALRGLLGKRMVSIPFSPWVPLLATDDSALQHLMEAAEKLCREAEANFVALRHGLELPHHDGWQRTQDNLISTLDLRQPIEEIWKGVDPKSARWAVNRACRDGVVVDKSQSFSTYKAFYELVVQTRRRQGVPVYPPQLFDSIWQHLGTKQLSQIMLARAGHKVVAGVVMLKSRGTLTYGYAASVSGRKALRSQPMDLLVWEAIREAHEEGASFLDFGSTPSFNRGLLRFKEKWGATSRPLPYYFYAASGHVRSVNRQGLATRAVGAAISRLPDWGYIWASTRIMKQIG